ncbi:MAG: hypothetical protein WBA51_10740 [Erythrobacter sp.]
MDHDEWEASDNAPSMLMQVWQKQPDYLSTQVRSLHRFLIDCCWKHQNLIPQSGLRDGLRGAEKWLAGEIGYEALNRLNYYAEADAFMIDYAKSSEDLDELKALIDSVSEVRSLPFKDARALLLKAAYFAEGSMIYPMFNKLPYVDSLFTSEFLCPNLLRHHLKPSFDD